jgi:hypothetical protein
VEPGKIRSTIAGALAGVVFGSVAGAGAVVGSVVGAVVPDANVVDASSTRLRRKYLT